MMTAAPKPSRGTRDGFGQALVELGQRDPRIVVLTADLRESTRVEAFANAFPERFIDVGVAEQNLMGVAAGLAQSGKIPFIASYAVFSPGRNWDQLRVSVCYSQANVKIVSTHCGLNVGPDGATHQALEDLAMTRVLPNLTVVAPCDFVESYQATLAAAAHEGPVYLRLTRDNSADLTTTLVQTLEPFALGRARSLRHGKDVTLIGCGPLLNAAVAAAEQLATEHIEVEVIDLHTIKPLDEVTLLESVAKTGGVVTVEEHQRAGGLAGAVSELLAHHLPLPLESVAMPDSFGQSGSPQELLTHYGLDANHIIHAVHRVLERKRRQPGK